MKNIDVGQTIQILANIGVIAGIIFLGIELRQNNALLEAQVREANLNVRQRDSILVLNNPDLANALIKHRRGGELTEYDDLILTRYMETFLTGMQYTYNEMVSSGADMGLDGLRTMFTGETLSVPGYWPVITEYWEANKFTYQPDFVQWMEENIVNAR